MYACLLVCLHAYSSISVCVCVCVYVCVYVCVCVCVFLWVLFVLKLFLIRKFGFSKHIVCKKVENFLWCLEYLISIWTYISIIQGFYTDFLSLLATFQKVFLNKWSIIWKSLYIAFRIRRKNECCISYGWP